MGQEQKSGGLAWQTIGDRIGGMCGKALEASQDECESLEKK